MTLPWCWTCDRGPPLLLGREDSALEIRLTMSAFSSCLREREAASWPSLRLSGGHALRLNGCRCAGGDPCTRSVARVIKLLLQAGANPSAKSHKKNAPLHLAAGLGDATVVKPLNPKP